MVDKICIIEWVDSLRSFDWTLIEDVNETSLNCVSVGFVVEDAKDYITIAQNYGTKPKQVCNLITIPKCSIKEIKELSHPQVTKKSEHEGVDQGKREMLEKVCEYIKENLYHAWINTNNGNTYRSQSTELFIKELRKAMEEE